MSDVPDIFHAQASANQTARTRDISLRCHFKLGFIINLTKSAFVPSQVMLHLGAPINTARGLVFPSPASGRSNNSCISSIVRPNPGLCSMPSAGDRAVGFLPCSCPPLHVLSSSSVKSPERSLRHEGRSHFEADPLVISSDLVSSGTLVSPGSCVPRRSSSTPSSHTRPNDRHIHLWMGSGLRSSDDKGCVVERSVFSPYKLSRAGDCFPQFHRWLCGAHVLVQMDSTTVMHYLNRAGGTRSICLDWKVREIIHWCLSMRITLSAVHISGQDNVEADHFS